MGPLVWIVGIVAALFAIDRLLLWMEAKGWIYWRKVKSKGGAGSAFLGVESITNPNAEHIFVARETIHEDEEDGDDDGKRRRRRADLT